MAHLLEVCVPSYIPINLQKATEQNTLNKKNIELIFIA